MIPSKRLELIGIRAQLSYASAARQGLPRSGLLYPLTDGDRLSRTRRERRTASDWLRHVWLTGPGRLQDRHRRRPRAAWSTRRCSATCACPPQSFSMGPPDPVRTLLGSQAQARPPTASRDIRVRFKFSCAFWTALHEAQGVT